MTETRKAVLLRLDPAVHRALARWAADELRSATAQIEFLLRQVLTDAGRMPRDAGRLPRRGRPAVPAVPPIPAGGEGGGGEDGHRDEVSDAADGEVGNDDASSRAGATDRPATDPPGEGEPAAAPP